MAVLERRVVEIRGVVQGVDFRPFVHEQFARELTEVTPQLARIESVVVRLADARGDSGFLIQPSRSDTNPSIYIAPDAATCDACLAELFDPANRRYRYAFRAAFRSLR